MKKLLILGAFAALGTVANAQTGFKLGAHVGAPVGDASNLSSVSLGIDAAYMWNVAKGLDVGATTGYSHFFGKNNFDDFGFIPLAASGKYRFSKIPLFVGLDLGAAISTNSNINTGFYIQPKVGYQMKNTEFYLGFQNVSSGSKHHRGYYEGYYWDDKYSFGSVNLGVNFYLK